MNWKRVEVLGQLDIAQALHAQCEVSIVLEKYHVRKRLLLLDKTFGLRFFLLTPKANIRPGDNWQNTSIPFCARTWDVDGVFDLPIHPGPFSDYSYSLNFPELV